MEKISDVIIVGGGTAGLICALTLRLKCPDIRVKVLRSKAIGVIGVGEGTIAGFNNFFFNYLGINRTDFYRETNATWKLGIRFNWNRGRHFNYDFAPACSWKWDNQKYDNGFYHSIGAPELNQNSALMDEAKAFIRADNGDPVITNEAAYHLENARMVVYLEAQVESCGATIVDTRIDQVNCKNQRVDSLTLDDGAKVKADLYIDASGFRSLLLQGALGVPFDDFDSSLFCDRAITGTWQRTDEPILPYTTSDVMQAGWSWQIDHEQHINRGYVYCSKFIDQEQAEAEFRKKNPKLEALNHLSFRPGKCRNLWQQNVVAIGNAGGFVEPLEATSIGMICAQSRKLAELLDSTRCRPDAKVRDIYNNHANEWWESARRFLALHYKLNGAANTPFWDHCSSETELGSCLDEMIAAYKKHGPAAVLLSEFIPDNDLFGINGYLVIMLGLGLQYDRSGIDITAQDRLNWKGHCDAYRQQAQTNSLSVAESLKLIRAEGWQWYN